MASKALGVDPEVYKRELREGKALLAKDVAKAQHRNQADLPLTDEKLHQARRARDEEKLARQIFNRSGPELGVQFSPEQARAAAKATGDLVGKNVNFNAALQSALAEQIQAMSAMGNQLMEQAGQMQQIRMQFEMVRRGIRTNQRSAGKRN
jgi:exopolyphosphatase/pppGpp-phosphohydrolase